MKVAIVENLSHVVVYKLKAVELNKLYCYLV